MAPLPLTLTSQSMPESSARLYLVSPPIDDDDAFAPLLAATCAAGDVAAVLLHLEAADERTLVNQAKALAPIAQERGAAALIAGPRELDLVGVAIRGGADGVHGPADPSFMRAARERLTRDRILGAGGIRSKDDAMRAGELHVDYVMFGEPRPDGSLPAFDLVVERAGWWAEIFQTPCVAFAPNLEAVASLAATGAEFVALGDAVWRHPDGPAAAVAAAWDMLEAREGAH
jgi:thiamine-phosphate pyrophosphorylase